MLHNGTQIAVRHIVSEPYIVELIVDYNGAAGPNNGGEDQLYLFFNLWTQWQNNWYDDKYSKPMFLYPYGLESEVLWAQIF